MGKTTGNRRKPPGPEDPLPTKPEIEMQVLGALQRRMVDPGHVASALPIGDFSREDNRTIYRRMLEIHGRGESIDRTIVFNELQKHGEHKTITLGYLVSLDDGLPELPNVDGHIRILREAATRRRIIEIGNGLKLSGADQLQDPALILRSYRKRMEETGENGSGSDGGVGQVPSIWSHEDQMNFLIEDFLIERAVSLISGESGDGKSTFMLALAGAVAQGSPFLGRRTTQRPVLYLDRENPAFVVKDRLFRLGIPEIPDRLKIWGTWWEGHYPPGPNATAVIEYARKMKALIIIDSLIAFAGCDENSSNEMRQHMALYRDLCAAGGTVAIVHHRSDKGEGDYRGSSDIRAVIDAGYRLSRDDQSTAADPLGRLVLKPYKTRMTSAKPIRIEYKDNAFVAVDAPPPPQLEVLKAIIRAYPMSTQNELIKQGSKHCIPKGRVLELLLQGINAGEIDVKGGAHNKRLHSLHEAGLTE